MGIYGKELNLLSMYRFLLNVQNVVQDYYSDISWKRKTLTVATSKKTKFNKSRAEHVGFTRFFTLVPPTRPEDDSLEARSRFFWRMPFCLLVHEE